ncbi:MAG TPA: glycoside hydrolase family 3 N-terminal domain-containing protein [Longimicrobiales bacterium]|nr:glycoside hydrolase family 3 N-terminal domain-containing protein [Longimicrobiales bacterium]
MTFRSPPAGRLPGRALALALSFLASGCGLFGSSAPPPAPEPAALPQEAPPVVEGEAVMTPEDSALIRTLLEELEEAEQPGMTWAERTLQELTLRQKVGQLIMPWVLGDFAPEGSPSHERISEYIERYEIGGVIMSVGTPFGIAAKLNDLQRHSRLPLLVAADLETGAGFRMRGAVYMPGTIDLGGATDFPSLMAVGATGDPELAYEMGRITAIEARAVGIHVPFAPVLDVNNNPENPIINVRSFGEDPADVSRLGIAFIRGVQENGAIATGKHFPGHGDTEVDSHIALPVIRHDRARMDSVELRPFKAAIDAGLGAIMTAHISVPSLNGGVREASTLSPLVLTTVLRDELGFDGLVFTDAMDMSAIARRHSAGEAAARAIEAGADIILMPPDVGRAIDGIVEAVESGRITEERIDESVLRVLQAKERLGLHEERLVPIDKIVELVGTPEHLEVADRIAERSITLLKNERDLLPLNGTRTASVLSVSFRRQSDVLAGRYFDQELRRTYPRLSTADLGSDADPSDRDAVLRRARGQNLVIVGVYSSYAGGVDGRDQLAEFVEQLGRIGVPHVVVSFGNPYLISSFPSAQAYLLAWNGSMASQRAAAKALLGEIDVTGRVPTSIPPLYALGDGIRVPMRVQQAGGR